MPYGGYKKGAIVLQQSPSPLHYLFGGISQGASMAMEKHFQKKNQQRQMAAQVLESVLSGKIPPSLWATDIGQAAIKQFKLEDNPAIQKMREVGLREFTPAPRQVGVDLKKPVPETLLGKDAYATSEKQPYPDPKPLFSQTEGYAVNIPQPPPTGPIPFSVYRQRQKDLEHKAAMSKMDRDVIEYGRKEIIKREIEKSMSMSLPERIRIATKQYMDSMKYGIPPESVTVTDPQSGTTFNLFTHVKQQKAAAAGRIANSKQGIQYLRDEIKYWEYQASAAKMFHNLNFGKDPFAGTTEKFKKTFLSGMGGEIPAGEKKYQVQRLLPLVNAKLKALFGILVKQKGAANDATIVLPFLKQFKMPEVLKDPQNPKTFDKYAGEFESIQKFNDMQQIVNWAEINKRDIEAVRPDIQLADRRAALVPPPAPVEEDEKEEEEAVDATTVEWGPDGFPMEAYGINTAGEILVNRGGIWVKAKKK